MKNAPLPYLAMLLITGLCTLTALSQKAAPSPVQELRIQQVGNLTYFHVQLEPPRDLMPEGANINRGFFSEASPSLAPRLVSADGQVRLVCRRLDRNGPNGARFGVAPPVEPGMDELGNLSGKGQPPARETRRQPAPVQGLEFVGRCDAKGEVKLKLLYPHAGRRVPVIGRVMHRPPSPVWEEMDVVLDFANARLVPIPKEAGKRKEKAAPNRQQFTNPPVRDDLEGLWAVAQTEQFVELDTEVTEFGFYSFAATAIARKYGVEGQNLFFPRLMNRFQARGPQGGPGEIFNRELYETTTGAAAVTESLQLRRMNEVAAPRAESRIVPISKIEGIDIAEHPWEKMMGEKKPAPEAFAKLIPYDNYYIHFKRIARFNEFSELMDQWGTTLTRAYEITSRDHRLKQRYEQQLCLRSTALGKTLGPLVIKGIAITGSDAYLREGSDLAILFQVFDRNIFLGAVEPFVGEARKKFGDQLKESQADYQDVTIESFVTPHREVSLHRANLGDVVIYANSPVGIRRILDAAQGRSKSLADALDFQYMRTIFRYDDKDEDGFAFLSDPFIRNLVGPASKIKEKRRLEALASLHMLKHGAMLTSWESGTAPRSAPDILQAAGLKAEELPMPEGKPAIWDTEKSAAVSEAYNTIHFATPLIELPIALVTKTEAEEYRRFRLEYLGLWRQYFDPIGMRVSLRDGRVKLDTYILPLIENSAYDRLRAITGKGTVRLDPSSLSSQTLFQYMMHLSTDVTERGGWFDLAGGPRGGALQEFGLLSMAAWAVDPIGEWFLVRADDSPNYERLVHLAERAETGAPVDTEEVARLVWTLPLAIGFDVKNPLTLTGALTALRTDALLSLPGALTWAPLEKEYKGISIVCVRATPAGRQMLGRIVPEQPRRGKEAFLPAVYYAMIDGGFYLTLNEEMMRKLIDAAVSVKARDKVQTVDINSSLHLAPGAAEHTKGVLKRYLEMQTHHQARTSLPVWYALYRCGVVPEDAAPDQAAAAAYRYLGFVPVSPDGAAYRYEHKYDEVTNERHGSFRKPSLQKTMANSSPVNRLLESLHSVRADLRFREDGIQTVLTLDRAKTEK